MFQHLAHASKALVSKTYCVKHSWAAVQAKMDARPLRGEGAAGAVFNCVIVSAEVETDADLDILEEMQACASQRCAVPPRPLSVSAPARHGCMCPRWSLGVEWTFGAEVSAAALGSCCFTRTTTAPCLERKMDGC